MDILCMFVCIVFCIVEVGDMYQSASDESLPLSMRAFMIVADGLIMYGATYFLWPR